MCNIWCLSMQNQPTKVLGRSDWLPRHPYGFAKVFSLMVKVVAMWFLGCSEQCLSVLRWLLELCCVVVKWPKRGHSIQNKKQKQHKQTKPKTKKNISNKTPGKPTNKSTEPKIKKTTRLIILRHKTGLGTSNS